MSFAIMVAMTTDPIPLARLEHLKGQFRTWTAVAKHLGYSQPYISDVIHGRRGITEKMRVKLGLRPKYRVVRK